jgi:SpoVK/Ycf46/Vps4 family AAA+-type ATPase
MSFSNEYLYENYKRYYEDGLAAVQEKQYAIAKDKLEAASDYAKKLALVSDGEKQIRLLNESKRLKAVVDSIEENFMNDGNPTKKYANNFSDEGNCNDETKLAEMQQFFEFYTVDALTEGFNDVVGLDEAKAVITDCVINPMRYPEAYNYKFLGNRAILLEGPPGTGKTTFAKAVAKEIDQPFALIKVGALVNCLVGETGKNIDKVFAFLRDYAATNKCGITIFFDELDEIAKKRGSDDKTSETAVPALLRNMDGVIGNKGFLILANTNRKDMLDSAIAERFTNLIYIPLPDSEMRFQLFKKKLSDIEESFLSKIDFALASERSEGVSGRDITYICDSFKFQLSKFKAGLIDVKDLNEVLGDIIDKRRKSKNIK